MSGSGVKAIQWALNDMGYDAGSVDGIYGYATHFAVQRFQSAEGI
jgi:peptidoglycan hydrolase-like protein with peptidoglycan-binding domain